MWWFWKRTLSIVDGNVRMFAAPRWISGAWNVTVLPAALRNSLPLKV